MLTILTYHSLDTSGSVISMPPNVFAEQMTCMAELGYRGITLSEAIGHHATHGQWPTEAVTLTFDDGYLNFYDEALPILTRHGFHATLFVVSGHVGGFNDWAPPPASLGTRPLLTWDQLAELAAAGMEVGSHSRAHPDLRRLSPPQIEREVVGSRREIEHHIGREIETFAYPFGAFSESARRTVASEYRAACTTALRRVGREPLCELPRVDTYYVRSPRRLQSLLTGRLDGYLTVRRWGRALKQRL